MTAATTPTSRATTTPAAVTESPTLHVFWDVIGSEGCTCPLLVGGVSGPEGGVGLGDGAEVALVLALGADGSGDGVGGGRPTRTAKVG